MKNNCPNCKYWPIRYNEKPCSICSQNNNGEHDCWTAKNLDLSHLDLKEVRPTTVGELREFLLPFDDECPLMGLNYGGFRYVLNEKGEGLIQFA